MIAIKKQYYSHKTSPKRVQRVLEVWVSSNWVDFRTDEALHQRIVTFAESLSAENVNFYSKLFVLNGVWLATENNCFVSILICFAHHNQFFFVSGS
jgi:hypothetical protein